MNTQGCSSKLCESAEDSAAAAILNKVRESLYIVPASFELLVDNSKMQFRGFNDEKKESQISGIDVADDDDGESIGSRPSIEIEESRQSISQETFHQVPANSHVAVYS
jgi:hypothetical protein